MKNAEQLKAKGEAVLKQGEEDLEKSREAFEKGDIDSAVKGTLKTTDKLKGFFNK